MSEEIDSGAKKKSRGRRVRRTIKGVRRGAENAMILLREGRLSAPYKADFEVLLEESVFRLRRYTKQIVPTQKPISAPLLFVPPLMVTSEIYDISPELSAVTWLAERGVDVWLVDFGSPDDYEGGLDRTLDDHILAVDRCIDEVRKHTGSDVHLAGYSQGGMFCYQTAAYRKSEGLRSVITFGSPVDVRKIIPIPMHGDLVTRMFHSARDAVKKPLDEIKALPGFLTSTAFKVLSAGKEVQQIVDFFGVLPDREALEKREPTRRFLGGEGFVAWPAPALRRFIDEVVVKNLMANGGLVINKRPVTMADITCPVLYFVGLTDIIARPESVRSIQQSAPMADLYEIDVAAGHFGLVVGSKAFRTSWPTVLEWMQWHGGMIDDPSFLDAETDEEDDVDDDTSDAGFAYDLASGMLDGVWSRLGDVSMDVSNVVETMRWQIPRLTRLRRIDDSSRISPGRALADQARAIPDSDFFLWGERAFTYKEADNRVNQTIHAFRALGIKPRDKIGVMLDNHPDYLTACVALNRMGAIAVLFNAGISGSSLDQAIAAVETSAMLVDRSHTYVADHYDGLVVRIGRDPGEPHPGISDLRDVWDKSLTEPPDDILVNAGRGGDTAFLMFTSGTTGMPKAARITNRRWGVAALGTAASAQLTNRDTVYCSLPLYHATGLLIGCGGALVGGARLALAPKFSTSTFWNDVHRYGASVVIYVGELCRYLVNSPPSPIERNHSVRVLAGNGMRQDVWSRVTERFGNVKVLEFYGSTEGNVALVNLTGKKVGSVGRPIVDSSDIELATYDSASGSIVRAGRGRGQRAEENEPGLLLSRVAAVHPLAKFDGYVDPDATEKKLLRNVFEEGDAWFNTGDVLRRDKDGDYWFVDRVGDTFRWKGENVSTEQVTQILLDVPSVDFCAVYGVELPGREGRAGMAAIQLKDGQMFDRLAVAERVNANLFPAARPVFIRIVESLPITNTLKLVKVKLQKEGANPRNISDALYFYNDKSQSYEALSPIIYESLVD